MLKNTNILIVDDDATNLRILEDMLETEGCNTLKASDGIEAMALLEAHPNMIDLALVDRMMPNMDGITLTCKMKEDPRFKYIPIIIQTAAVRLEQVQEGVSKGAYYYLKKPFEEEDLLPIVNAALYDSRLLRASNTEAGCLIAGVGLLTNAEFNIRTLQHIETIVPLLCAQYPDPMRVGVGIHELLINALEHGNLGVGYEEKTRIINTNCWREMITAKQNEPEYRNKAIRIQCTRSKQAIELAIEDEGQGFEWDRFMAFDPHRATHTHGRGIAIANQLSFDHLQFEGAGNRVLTQIKL